MPWRIVLGALGVYVVGPQNWVIRVIRERKNGGPQAWNLDVILREKKKSILSSSGNHEEDKAHNRAFYFSSHTPNNCPVRQQDLDTSDVKHVAVPHSQLNYRRFYDWPPEPAYARVWKSTAPMNNASNAQMVLQSCGEENVDVASSSRNTTTENSEGRRGKKLSVAKRLLSGFSQGRRGLLRQRKPTRSRIDEATV